MEAVRSGSGALVAGSRRGAHPLSSCKALTSSWIPRRFLRASNNKASSGYPILCEAKPIRSLPPSSSSSSSSSPSLQLAPEADADTAESHVQTANELRTVHVKFVLQKACIFGQQFLIVGDDPVFGLWDPSKAIPLDWSDGHVWTAELDLPVGKSVRFKFILQGSSGEIEWQPGPDRVLQTWETKNTIIVLEDWENSEDQKIIEEGSENQKTIEGKLSAFLVDEVISEENKVGESDNQKIIEDESPASLAEEVISNENKVGTNRKAVSDEIQEGMSDRGFTESMTEDKKLSSHEGDLVLVPGLAPIPLSETASAYQSLNGDLADASITSDEANDFTLLQLAGQQEEPEAPSENQVEEHTMMVLDDMHNVKDDTSCQEDDPEEFKSQSTIGAIRNDIQGGCKTLHQFLLNLGFPFQRINDNSA